MRERWTAALLLLFVVITSESKLLKLGTGSTYQYSYSGWAETSLSPHSSRPQDHDDQGLLINATVSITALSPCEVLLEMSSVKISGGTGVDHVAELERESLRASLQAGRFETLCVNTEEDSVLSRWALNVKRGVLSALQVSLKSTPQHTGSLTVHESDVSGTCRTQYEYLQLERSTFITKKKDLSLCSGRAKAQLNLDNTYASTPLLRGDQECIQTITDGHISMVRCRENHLLQPFSSGDHGATTRVEQVLILENIINKVGEMEVMPAVHRRTSLVYEHVIEEESSPAGTLDDTRALLQDLASSALQRNTATQFAQLLRVMRAHSREQLLELVANTESDLAKGILLDALPSLDTAAGTSAMTSLYIARAEQAPWLRQWLEEHAATWFSALATSRRADTSMLSAVIVLLRELESGRVAPTDSASVVLGVSGLAHALCDKLGSTQTCSQEDSVREVVSVMERVISPESGQSQRNVILAMKGLGNLGVFFDAKNTLQKYYMNASAPLEVRLAAIDALRRAPCSLTEPLLDVYTNTQDDVEARIAAYLAVVRCPSSSLLRAVKRALYSETVNQVGSFVWTHLTNSQESTSKARQTLRALLGNEFLQNKFRTDARQFSRNFEFSRYFESLGAGATADANVIFSTKSYLPRSAMFNLTVDLFGESVNLLEVGARVEGMEPMLERLFSKRGILENEAVEKLLRNSRDDSSYDKILNKTIPLKQITTPKASTYIRLFGSEVSYMELSDMMETSSKFDLSPQVLLKHLINRKEHEFSRSLELIDVSQYVPTALGLPLTISVNATASIKLAARGHFESNSQGLQINGKLNPSANIALNGFMKVGNADFIQGIKFEGNAFTHTSLNSRLKITSEGKLNIQTDMPSEKQTIIEMTSKRFIFNGNKIVQLPDVTPNRETYIDCTGDFTDQLLGVKLCSEISYPNATDVDIAPYFPLTGDANINITIVKTDPTFKTYDFSTSWTYVPGIRYDFGISYDRLGSSFLNRRRVVQAVYDRDAGVARLTFDIPEKQAEVAVSWDSKSLNAAELVATYEREVVAQIYAQTAHHVKPTNKDILSGKYEPELRFNVKGLPNFIIKGVINYVADTKVSAELRLEGLIDRPLTLGADYTRDHESGALDARLSVDTPWVTWDIKGGAKLTTSSLGLRVSGSYNVSVDPQHTIDLSAKYNWNTQGALRRDYLNLRTQMSQWPDLSGQVTAEAMTSRGYYEGMLALKLRKEEWNITQRAQSSGGGDVWLSQTVHCPAREIDFKFEHRHKLKETSFTTTTTLHVDRSRNTLFHLDMKHIPGDGVAFSAECTLRWPGITFSNGNGPYLKSRLYQVSPGHYQAYLDSQWHDNRDPLNLQISYADKSSLKALKHILSVNMIGALGFNKENELILSGSVQAESGRALGNVSLKFGDDEKVKIEVTYDLEMQEKHSFVVQAVLWNKKTYKMTAAVVNTDLEKSLALDLEMSKHLAFDIKMAAGTGHARLFWDKTLNPDLNVTLSFDMETGDQAYKCRGQLLYPGQKITALGSWVRRSETITTDEKVYQIRGNEVEGKLTWLPEREIKVFGSFHGSVKSGLKFAGEISTGDWLVLGEKRRYLTANYVPGSPATLTTSYAWGDTHNISSEFTLSRKNNGFEIEMLAVSTLWRHKQAKAKLSHTASQWSSVAGEMSASWAGEGLALYWGWDLRSDAKLGVRSWWSRVPTCGLEVRLDGQDEETGQLKQWIKLYHEDQRWEAVLTQARSQANIIGAQLDVLTPLKEYSHHQLNVTVKLGQKMSISSWVNTPLLGDYSLTAEYSGVSQIDTSLHILNADTTILKVSTSIQATGAKITLLIPEICNLKSSVYIRRDESGINAKFNFENNKKLLHEFDLTYKDNHFENGSVDFQASFSGFSYLVMNNKWQMEFKHAGIKTEHTSYLKINQLTINHAFKYVDNGEWNFKITSYLNGEIINVLLSHAESTSMNYYINFMNTEVLNVRAKLDEGFVNVNFMDSILQINSKFTYEDELKLITKIIADSNLVATLTLNQYIKSSEGEIESMILSCLIESNVNKAELKINMDAGVQITGSLNVNYEEHKLKITTDILSLNNSIGVHYSKTDIEILALNTFCLLTDGGSQFVFKGKYKEHTLKMTGDMNFDEQQNIEAQAKIDSSFNNNVFPISLITKISLPEKRVKMSIFDVNNSGVAIEGRVIFEPNLKAVTFKGSMPGYNDEFINLVVNYKTDNAHEVQILFEKKRYRYYGEFLLSDVLLKAKIETPIPEYEDIKVTLGVIAEIPKRVVLEFRKPGYTFDSEMLFTHNMDNSQVVVIAKSSTGLDLEALFTKIRSIKSTDCLLTIKLNDETLQAGALLEYGIGSLTITSNVTKDTDTARMVASITRTDIVKKFKINSEFRGQNYTLEINSSNQDTTYYEQYFEIISPSFNCMFRYEKSDFKSVAFLQILDNKLRCELNGNVMKGELSLLHMNFDSYTDMKFRFNFEKKLDVHLHALINEPMRESIELTMAYSKPLKVRALYDSEEGKANVNLKYKEMTYLADSQYLTNEDGSKLNLAVETPHFEKTLLNISYKFAEKEKEVALHFDYGSNFYDIFLGVDVSDDVTQLNLNVKSSLPNFERIKLTGSFKNTEDFSADINLNMPSEFYVITCSFQNTSFDAKLQTSNREFQATYTVVDTMHSVSLKMDKKEILNSTFTVDDTKIIASIMTPYEKYRNVTVYVGMGSDTPRKDVEIHHNNDLIFHAYMYPVENEDIESGTGIIATFYQGREKLVYDAQFSVANPVYVILKQHENINGTRDILHIKLDVTDEYTATGEATILLPIAPHTKILAKGHIQIENNNAEFRVSYQMDGEKESNFSINYHSYTDDYNIYNIVTDISTPFKGYESISLKMQSSLTETIVHFTSPFLSYEDIKIVSIHRLNGTKKELQVQYQNKEHRIFYLKALFINEARNKVIDLEARSQVLNGQAIVYSNTTHTGVKLEQDRVILTEIISHYENVDKGFKYEFTFRKVDKLFELQANFIKNINIEFNLDARLDNEIYADIDFLMTSSGHVTATLILPQKNEYSIAGDIDIAEKAVQMSMTAKDVKTELSFVLKSKGFVQVKSTLFKDLFNLEWDIQQFGANFTMTAGSRLGIHYLTTESLLDLSVVMRGNKYAFTIGQVVGKGWPNVKCLVIWNSESLIDFQHQYLTDSHLTLIKTRLTSPYLGTHKNMKFECTLKTKDILSIEVEFKWRPKDLTAFKSQLKLDMMSSLASVDFKSPFSSDFLFTAAYDFKNEEKNIEIFYQLTDTVSLKATIIPKGSNQKLNVTLTSPLKGYKYVNLLGLHTNVKQAHTASLKFTKESTISEAYITIDSNAIKSVLTSGDIRWILTGNHEFTNNIHKFKAIFQWGGIKDIIQAELQYKPGQKIEFNIDEKYIFKLEYKTEWNDDMKYFTIDTFIKRNELTAELNFHLARKDKVIMIAASTKSPIVDYIRVSSVLDAESQELRGALQINETVYTIHASRIDGNEYTIALLSDDVMSYHFDVSFDGDLPTGLKVQVTCNSPNEVKIQFEGLLTLSDYKKFITFDVSWGEKLTQIVSFTYILNEHKTTEIQAKVNTHNVPDFETYVNYGLNYFIVHVKNQTENLKGRVDYNINNIFSVNSTIEYNENTYIIKSYVDPKDIAAVFKFSWPHNNTCDFAIQMRPGDIFISISTPFMYLNNIHVAGKYIESTENNVYQLTSSANAKWDDFIISLKGSIRNFKDNYGLAGTLNWGHDNAISLSCDVLHNKTLLFKLNTPFKGLPHISAKLEAIKNRHLVTGINGEITTPFTKLPQVNFTFNRVENIIEAQFSFDTSTYKNILIHTKFSTLNNKNLYLQMNTPFLSQVKTIKIDTKVEKLQGRIQSTKVALFLDDKLYELRNNYTIINNKLDSYVYLSGPKSTIELHFGGKFIMNSFSDFDVEAFVNNDIVSLKYNILKGAKISGHIYLPASGLWKTPTEFSLNVVKDTHFEGIFNYNYGGLVGKSLLKNKITDDSLETVMYLNLPRILKNPLQLELNANYLQPRIQFTGYASFIAEHRLDLTMTQNSFRTTLDAHLDSAFFKGTKKFSLSLTSDTLSITLNDELRVTGHKKPHQLILTLSQLMKKQDHVITYSWELLKIPKIEVTLESPILSAKKATFTATYMGLMQGVNMKLVSGTESLRLDYKLIDQKKSKGIKIQIGNAQSQMVDFAATMAQVTNGHEVIAQLKLLELTYKTKFNYSLPTSKENPMFTAALKLETPYLFPIKFLNINFKAGQESQQKYLLAVNTIFDTESIDLRSEIKKDSLNIVVKSSIDYIASCLIVATHKTVEDKSIIDMKVVTNNVEVLTANASLINRSHSIIIESHAKAKIPGFEELHMKMTIPSELKYSLIANVELHGSSPFKAYLIITSRPAYTNVELAMTGLTTSIHLTSNQAEFSYKSGPDDYRIRVYSKSSGHELHSELTINNGSVEILKTGLFGMYHNHTDFYILMSSNSIYEPIQSAVFYVGAEKSQLRFGAEYEGSIEPAKQSYTATLNHHINSLTDFDLGLRVEHLNQEMFNAKLTHALKPDFYLALAQINKSILKITQIRQDDVMLGTATLKHDELSSEISGKLILHSHCKGLDIKITLQDNFYQVGGQYNITEEHFKLAFDLDSPYTKHNSINLELAQPDILYLAVDHQHAPKILVDFHPNKTQSKYILFNLTETKFLLTEFSGESYDLSSSLLYRGVTYQAHYEFTRDEDSYSCNTTVTLPTRTLNLYRQRIKKEFHTASQIYFAWEKLSNRIGYGYDVYKDRFKTNVKLNLEVPNRAVELKTHKRFMVIDDNLTDIEYGVQFNWNTKVHSTPVTVVASVKFNHHVGYLYIVLAHPAFNSTLALDAQLKHVDMQDVHISAQLGSVHAGVMEPIATSALNISGTEYNLLLQHPASKLHHVWYLKLSEKSIKITLKDALQKRHATLAAGIKDNRLDASISCDELEIKLAAELDIDHLNSRYGVIVSGSYDPLVSPLAVTATFDRLDAERLRFVVDLSLSEDRGYYGEARYSPTDISAKVLQREYSATYTALHAAVTLNDSETLSVRGRYRAELWSNITVDFSAPVQRASLVGQQLLTRVRNMFSEEVVARLNMLSSSVTTSSAYRRVLDHTKVQWTSLKQDFAAIRNLLVNIYNSDEFYIKTIWQFTVKTLWQGKQVVGAGLSSVISALKTLVTNVLPDLLTTIYRGTLEPLVQGLQKLAPSMSRFIRKITDAWRKIQTSVTASVRTTVGYLREAALVVAKYSSEQLTSLTTWLNETKEILMQEVMTPWLTAVAQLATDIDSWITQLNEEISRLPQLVEDYVMSLEETQAILKLYKSFAYWLEEINFTEIIIALRKAFKIWYAGVTEELRTCLGENVKYINIALDTMKGTYDEVLNLPPVIYARMIHTRISDKLEWTWHYYKMDKTLEEIIIRLSDEILAMILESTQLDDFGDDIDDKFHFDATTGDFSGTFELPFTWRRFDTAPKLQQNMQGKLEKLRFTIMDKMYHLASENNDWKDSLYRTILPPFSSSSLISVSGHIITFDGKHFKIKDQLCGTYLLAADYHDNKFAVSVNYGEQGTTGALNSVTLHSKSGHRIDLAFDTAARTRGDDEGFSKLVLDGVKMELPMTVDGVLVTREGQMVTALSDEGVALRCNVIAGLCSIELPGWFHGRVTGLAGSVDKEPGNDIINNSVQEALSQWRVSSASGCSTKMTKAREGRARSSPTCTLLFKSSDSPLQPCFARLDPAPFSHMCELDVASGNRADRAPECQAAEAYVEQCKFVGMDISMPPQCIQCRLPSGQTMEAGDVVIYDSAPGSRLPPPPSLADVVLLIERGTSCLQPRDLAELPAKLESVMRATVNSTRFALVSFGADVAPAIHTIEGQIWSSRRGIQQALSTLELGTLDTEAGDRDLLNALLATSSKLSFRAGSSKSIVLAACTSCARSPDTATVFAEATSLLLEADMRLHVLQRDEMPLRRSKKRPGVQQGNLNPVMGVDSHGAYTGRRVKGTSIPLPSKAIMRQLSIPKDLCTPLALETNGTMFSAARLLRQEQQDAKRKWLDVWSRRVASSATPSACQTCECIPYTDGSSRVQCQPCVSPAIQHFLQEWEDFLEAAVLEEDEDSEDDISVSAETLDAINTRLQEEQEAERQVLNRLRDMLIQGKQIPDGL